MSTKAQLSSLKRSGCPRRGMLGSLLLVTAALVPTQPVFAKPLENRRILMHSGPAIDAVRVLAMADAAAAVNLPIDTLVLSGGSALAGYLLTRVPDASERLKLLSAPDAAGLLCQESQMAPARLRHWKTFIEQTAINYRQQNGLSPRIPTLFDTTYFDRGQSLMQLIRKWEALKWPRLVTPRLVTHGFLWDHQPRDQNLPRDATRLFIREVWNTHPAEESLAESLRGSESPLARENLHGALRPTVMVENHRSVAERLELAFAEPGLHPPFIDGQTQKAFLAGNWNQYPFELAQRLGSSILVADDGNPEAQWEDRLARAWLGVSLVERYQKARKQSVLHWVDFTRQREFFSRVFDAPYASSWNKARCTFPVDATGAEFGRWISAYYLYAYEQTKKSLRSR